MNGQLYKVLRVSPTAGVSTIRTAYRRAALSTHPDKGGSEKLFHLVALAFETLSHRASREAYDKLNGIGRCQAAPGLSCNNERSNIWCNIHSCSSPKRQRDGVDEQSAKAKPPKGSNRARTAVQVSRRAKVFWRLQNVLQSFDVAQRREAMSSMEPRIQRALLVHMQTHKNVKLSGRRPMSNHDRPPSSGSRGLPGTNSGRINAGSAPTKSGVSGIHKMGRLYRASIAVANMEMYSRMRTRLATAIDDHVILAQVQEIIMLNIDSKSSKSQQLDENVLVLRLCQRCLEENGVSEEEMQLRAKVRLRVGKWMGPLRISSPAMSLEEALAMRSKLLRSRQLSWQSFRIECVSVFQRMRRFHGIKIWRTSEEAEALADKAWARAASNRRVAEVARDRLLARALHGVVAVLDLEEHREAKERKRLHAVDTKRAQAEQRWFREELHKWARRRDVTMAEMTRGPPVLLRANMRGL